MAGLMRGWNDLGQFELADEDIEALADVPGHLLGGITRYVCEGIPPGDFLYAVVSNDLFEAMARADEQSRAGLYRIVFWFYNHSPSACHGSPSRVTAWVKTHAEKRAQAATAEPIT